MGLTFRLGQIPLGVFTDASNNVGIGAAPSGTYKLEVTGTAKVSSTLLVSGAATFSSSVTATQLNASISTSGAVGSVPNLAYFKNQGSGYVARMAIGDGTTSDSYISHTGGNTTATQYLGFGVNAYNQMVLNGAGFVGINNTNPASRLYVQTTAGATKAYDDTTKTNIMCFDDTSMVAGVGGSITFGGYKTAQTNGGNFAAIDGVKENGTAGNEAGAFRIWTANSSGVFGERMRITSGGDMYIGNTTISTANTAIFLQKSGIITTVRAYSSGTIPLVEFYRQSAGDIGSITYNGTNTLYGGTSDYRLKEDLKDYNALDIVNQLKTYNFKWKDTDVRDYGMMAHELQEILPNYVSGEKDAIREDGSIKSQNVDYSKLVPILIKGMQEQQEMITSLQDRLDKAGL